MTLTGWLSLGVEVGLLSGFLFGCAWVGRKIGYASRCWWVRRERDRIASAQRQKELDSCELCKTVVSPHPHLAIRDAAMRPDKSYIFVGGCAYELDVRRSQLEGLATSSDKTARRIVQH